MEVPGSNAAESQHIEYVCEGGRRISDTIESKTDIIERKRERMTESALGQQIM